MERHELRQQPNVASNSIHQYHHHCHCHHHHRRRRRRDYHHYSQHHHHHCEQFHLEKIQDMELSIYLPLSTKFPIYQFFVCFFIVIYQFVFCEYFSWLVFTHLWIFTLVFTKHQALVFFKIVHGDQLVELKAEEEKNCCCFVLSKDISILLLKVFVLSLWLTINIRF